MFSRLDTTKKNQFLEQTKSAREERAYEKKREVAATKLQAWIRGNLHRKHFKADIRKALDELLNVPSDAEQEYKPQLAPALGVYQLIKRLLFIYNYKEDTQRFIFLCRYLLAGMNSDNLKECYVSMALLKAHVLSWIKQLKDVLMLCCDQLRTLRPESHSDMKVITVHLHMLISFTSPNTWKVLKGKAGEPLKPGMNQLCNNVMGHLNSKGLYTLLQDVLTRGLSRSRPVFKHATLSAIMTLAMRPLLAAGFSDNLLSAYLLHILSVPAIIHHVAEVAPECMDQLVTNRVFMKCLNLLANEQSTRIIFNSLEGNYALCMLANLIQLGETEMEGLVDNAAYFMTTVVRLLDCCQTYVQNKKSNLTHWHPVLGWFSQRTDQCLHEAMPYVSRQLQLLWGKKMVRILFSEMFAHVKAAKETAQRIQTTSPSKGILKKAIEKASTKNNTTRVKLASSVVTATCLPCSMYQTALKTLTGLRLDILGGLSYQEELLPNLWYFLQDLGPSCGLKSFLEMLYQAPNSTIHPAFSLLGLFCDLASHLITILDEVEIFEQQKPFSVEDYTKMAAFLNQFVFRVIWSNLMDVKTAAQNDVFTAVHTLLMVLYERDCRRAFTPGDFWMIKEVKMSVFVSELEKGRKSVQFLMQRVPHVIPFKERVIMFRKNVAKEKDLLGLTESAHVSPQSIPVTVHRSRIIEDGYRQLALLNPNTLKGIIRVKFINEQGLDEAGIDQDGVFKEFLEETIARVFDPSLNLFKATSEQKLYPSPTSYIQENHLCLLEFVGKMLGKAVYEGIVVDVPFASFFLTQILGHQFSMNYSFLDELPSMDSELYKSLTYIKHYEGDVSDLDLTFSCDEDFLGKLMTHELVPGGRAVPVTNDNRISYVHQMALFRMYGQIKDQSAAFIRGFKSIINSDWLMMFSAPELQKLISGDTVDIDIDDLRRHTQYYGGYHNNHKVICWLWDILNRDFSQEEKGLFLKFVTSCSKPPLLGFANLEPPFSIRCVEVSDDQDTGDTVGSVLKGFFNIKRRDPIGRLPTSSTCFNLLKLPNYQKKGTLKEKLRYAIHSNTGFELS
ncbi:ubiquitin-protein ligase E3B-like [Liolophura sinensis]|uniref:ubiquitin-protein ligase E3B-like n=1 Tax=Liolophura sinensis TaxID=3198878 RepID=UPI003158C8D2